MLPVVTCVAFVTLHVLLQGSGGQAQSSDNCIFNSTLCTCLFGSSDGDCWDPIDGQSGQCERRICDAGWTCDCDGDFFCHRGPVQVSLVDEDDAADESVTTASCTTVDDEIRINMAGCKLGHFFPGFSEAGVSAGACQNWVWYLNGELKNAFSNTDGSSANNDISNIAVWEDLPLKPGDVIGFRWRAEQRECYRDISEVSVNGTVVTTADSSALRHVWTNVFETDWFSQSFDDSEWNDPVLESNDDLWDADSTSSSNFYWRITIL